MIPLPKTSSPSTLRTRRVSPCEPLCARFGDGVACARRGDIQPARGKFRDGIKTTNTPPSPLRVQRFNGMKRTSRVVIPPPHRSAEKMQNGSFYHLPQQGSRRNPAKRFRWEEDERQRERVLPLAAGRGIRRPLGRRPASHLSGLRRSRCPAKCTGRAKALHPNSGRKPTPTQSCERFCGNAFTRLRRRSFKGGPVPL